MQPYVFHEYWIIINYGIRQRISIHIVAFLFLTMVEIFYCGNMSVLVIRYREIMNNATERESERQKQSYATKKKKKKFTNLTNILYLSKPLLNNMSTVAS